jgi:lipopolysaccharide transport system ATP-binding protein
LDTPVKRYSSGMYLRLAFAVAAHLEPEILLVDEVLAVGDIEFQKKCLGKMQDVATRHGRTVLFVSHNMAAIRDLCERTVLLVHGKVAFEGPPQTAISHYLSDAVGSCRVDLEDWTDRITTGEARITQLEFGDGNGGASIMFGGDLRIRMHMRFNRPFTNPIFGIIIHDATGVPVSNAESIHDGLHTGTASDELMIEAYFPQLSLYPGRYLLSPWIADSVRHDIDWPHMCAAFDIHPVPGKHGDLKLNQQWGKVFIPSLWKVERPC